MSQYRPAKASWIEWANAVWRSSREGRTPIGRDALMGEWMCPNVRRDCEWDLLNATRNRDDHANVDALCAEMQGRFRTRGTKP